MPGAAPSQQTPPPLSGNGVPQGGSAPPNYGGLINQPGSQTDVQGGSDLLGNTANLGNAPVYGGSNQGAGATFNYDAGLGAQAASNAAPQMNLDQSNADINSGYAGLMQQRQGLDALAQTAQGKGTAIQAATGQVAQQTAQQQQSNTAIANSAGGGGRGLASAQGQSVLANAQAGSAVGQQQQLVSAQMQQQAQGQYQQAAEQYTQNALGLQGLAAQSAFGQSQLNQQQQALDQQGQLGFLGLGSQAQQAQLSANSDVNSVTTQADIAAEQQKQAQNQAFESAALGGALALGGAIAGA